MDLHLPPPGPMYTCLDSQLELWSACAGELTQIPQVNSLACYFPQGHAEHSSDYDLASKMLRKMAIPSFLGCIVESVSFLAEHHTDNVLVKMKLRLNLNDEQPRIHLELQEADRCVREAYILFLSQQNELPIKEAVVAMLFPEVSNGQNVRCTDVHGALWEFRLTYERGPGGLRGPPVLTGGWEAFVTAKGLVAKDLIIFMRDKNGALRIGVRHWRITRSSVQPKEVVTAAKLAWLSKVKPFEVLYYPRFATPEFVIKQGDCVSAMSVPWQKGSKFLMSYKQVDLGQASNTAEGYVLSKKPADDRWPKSWWNCLLVSVPCLKEAMQVSPWTLTFLRNPEPEVKEPTKAGVVYPPVNPIGGSHLFPGAGAGTHPTRGGFGGGSMLTGMEDPRNLGAMRGRWGFPQPGILPPGGIPGARFDPYGPPDVRGFRPPRQPEGRTHPELEQPGTGGGSMLTGMEDPRSSGPMGGQAGFPGQPGMLPHGGIPGARFDPYRPPDVQGFWPPRQPGGRTHPELEQPQTTRKWWF